MNEWMKMMTARIVILWNWFIVTRFGLGSLAIKPPSHISTILPHFCHPQETVTDLIKPFAALCIFPKHAARTYQSFKMICGRGFHGQHKWPRPCTPHFPLGHIQCTLRALRSFIVKKVKFGCKAYPNLLEFFFPHQVTPWSFNIF